MVYSVYMMRKQTKGPTMKNKSTIAKLLATEDIFVVYKQMETAYFNSKTRELGLPIWKDEEMTADITDLMTCHEIGHALYTPLDMLETAALRGINHSFVNIIEDARIEKKVKLKYPGTVGCFIRGYVDLVSRDFFGTANKDMADLNLIDRINIFFKSGDKTIPFSTEEKVWVDRTAKTETPDDVLDLAEELYKWMSENESETDNHDNGENGESMDSGEEGEGSASGEKSEGDDNGDSDNGTSGNESNNDADDTKDGNGSNKGEEINEDSTNDTDRNGSVGSDDVGIDTSNDGLKGKFTSEGGVNSPAPTGPIATTDDASRDGMESLRDKLAKDRVYANIPKLDLDKLIVAPSVLIEEFGDFYSVQAASNDLYREKCAEQIDTLKEDSKRIVSYMVKEFEMKKSADAYARAAVSKTGSLDMGKLHTYKYNDDIFKKVTTLPGATNHGMVMCLDWSGSMADNLKGTLSQMFNLIWFCRQTRIPFEVFAFSDGYNRARGNRYLDGNESINPCQEYKAGDMKMRQFKLLNFFSNKMSIKDEIKMMNILFMYANRFSYNDRSVMGYPYASPYKLELGGTPLNDAIVAMMQIVPKFKSETGVQKVNTIFLTDGVSNNPAGVMDYDLITNENDRRGQVGSHTESTTVLSSWSRGAKEIIFTDPITNKTVDISGNKFSEGLLKLLKNRVYDMNVIGFFIAGSGRSGRVDKRTIANVCNISSYDKECMDLVKKINKEKYLAITSTGYDEMYILPGGNSLMVESGGLGDELIGATKAKLKSAFGKSMKGKIDSRQLLNKFVKLVA